MKCVLKWVLQLDSMAYARLDDDFVVAMENLKIFCKTQEILNFFEKR